MREWRSEELCGAGGKCVDGVRTEDGKAKYSCECEPGWSKPEGEEECSIDDDECSVNPGVCTVESVKVDWHMGKVPKGCVLTKRPKTGKAYLWGRLEKCEKVCEQDIPGCNTVSRYGSKAKKASEPYHCYFYNCAGAGAPETLDWKPQKAWGNYAHEAVTYFLHKTCTLASTDAQCDVSATCSNTEGSYSCECDQGFKGDGTSCDDMDECKAGTDSCDDNAMCSNEEGSYSCSCSDGFKGDGKTCHDEVCDLPLR